MSQFIETIKIKNGNICNLEFHNKRFTDTCSSHFAKTKNYDIAKMIEIPSFYKQGVFKLRIVYNSEKIFAQFSRYNKKLIQSLQCVYDDEIDYSFKHLNRNRINRLLDNCDRDDILIIKNGLVTDSSYANVAFKKKKLWYTPKRPLLNGTQRQLLIKQGNLIPLDIHFEEIKTFEEAALFNAMMPFDDRINIAISNIAI